MMGLDGGNLQMLDNWFVRNDIAVQVDECTAGGTGKYTQLLL